MRKTRTWWVTASTVLFAVGLSACGSDSKSTATSETTAGTPSSEAPSSEAPSSEAPSSEAPSSEAPSSEAPSSEAPSLDDVQARVAEYKVEPTSILVTTPLKSKPDPGETFVYLQCEASSCKVEADALNAATSAIGWDLKIYNYEQSNPATLISAMEQVLTLDPKPVAVAFDGLPEALWAAEIPKFKDAQIAILPSYLGPTTIEYPVLTNIGGSTDVASYGEILADWVATDSGGTAKVLLQSVNDFPILKVFSDTFRETLATNCPGCSVTEVNNTLAQVGGGEVASTVISGLQKDPALNYVVGCNGLFLNGLPSALAAAGLTGKVKVAAESANATNLTDLQTGKADAFVGIPLGYGAWLWIDAILRYLQGLPFDPANGGLPKQLLTKEVPFVVSDSYDKPADYQEQFKKLWLVA